MLIEVGKWTKVLMNEVQIVALAFMATVYALKVRWILRHVAGQEITPARGDHNRAIAYAYLTLTMPWELESLKKKPIRWVEFAAFHIGVAVAIGITFVLPYFPVLLSIPITIRLAQGVLVLALFAGISRMIRRLALPEMRAISSPDDYFAIIMLNAWLVTAIVGTAQTSEAWLAAFFAMTAFFLVYVPFSKISHYIYYPFVRYYVGKHFGHRGVFPKKVMPAETAPAGR